MSCPRFLPSTMLTKSFARSRAWVCPHCRQTNLHLLPETRHLNLASISGPQPSLLPSDGALSPESTVIHNIPPSAESHSPPLATDLVATQPATHSVDTATPQSVVPVTSGMIQSTRRKPLVLDTVICVLLAMAVAMICRRII